MLLFQIAKVVVVFGAASWAVDKVLTQVTGRDLGGNLDAGSAKVLDFVRPAAATTTEPTTTDVAELE